MKALTDIIGRRIVDLPVAVAVNAIRLEEQMEPHDIEVLLVCKACYRRNGLRGKSVVIRDQTQPGVVLMTCPCTKRLMRMGGPT